MALSRIAVFLFFVGCSHSQNSSERLVGRYNPAVYDATFQMELKSDGSYEVFERARTTVHRSPTGEVIEYKRQREIMERGQWSANKDRITLSSEEGYVRAMEITGDDGVITIGPDKRSAPWSYQKESNRVAGSVNSPGPHTTQHADPH